MTTLDFVALIFAASAMVDVWLNGSLFDEWRAYFQARSDTLPPSELSSASLDDPEPIVLPTPWWMKVFQLLPDWFCELLSCDYCLSHHTPWVLSVCFLLPAFLVGDPWGFILKIPVYSLAATRIGNIINRCMPADARYLREYEAQEPDDYIRN